MRLLAKPEIRAMAALIALFRSSAAPNRCETGYLGMKLDANMRLTAVSRSAKSMVLDGTHFPGAGLGIVKVAKVLVRSCDHHGLASRAGGLGVAHLFFKMATQNRSPLLAPGNTPHCILFIRTITLILVIVFAMAVIVIIVRRMLSMVITAPALRATGQSLKARCGLMESASALFILSALVFTARRLDGKLVSLAFF